jgi:hypothetical protein
MENHGKMYKNVIHIFECGEMSSIFLNVVDFHGGFSWWIFQLAMFDDG